MHVADLIVAENELRTLCERFGVKELALFGSRARGDHRKDSDVDLLVEFWPTTEIGFIGLGTLQQELSTLFDRKVDLVSKRGLKPRVIPRVVPQSKVIYHASR